MKVLLLMVAVLVFGLMPLHSPAGPGKAGGSEREPCQENPSCNGR